MTHLLSDRDGWIWFDGQMRPWRDCTTHVLTHTLHYGSGCFEGVRAYQTERGTAVFRMQDHTRRLFDSAKIVGLTIPYTPEQVNHATLEVLRRNRLSEAYIRPMAFFGAGGLGVRTDNLAAHLTIAAWTWASYLGPDKVESGLRVRTASFARAHANSSMHRAKANGQYIGSTIALNEVLKDGYDEAILLDLAGHVAEGSAENIFLVIDGALHTPDLTACLDGITRRTVKSLAQTRGIPVYERRITRDELYICDEAFFTGTLAEVLPIREIDHRPVGSGTPGPVTRLMQADYMTTVKGKAPEHATWLTWL
jgi:branched-chain amino acid aminotransferase